MTYILFALFITSLFISFYLIGEAFKYIFKWYPNLSSTVMGSGIVFGLLFLMSYSIVQNEGSFQALFYTFIVPIIGLFLLGIIKGNKKIDLFAFIYLTMYILFFVFLSSKLPLGEQMGDNVFYYQSVS